ncbi:MAG TPA: hypothetical protein VN026_19010 [Bacteroidia bacterium]|nr:hypothetical protein [Bacteroidia bacterium]
MGDLTSQTNFTKPLKWLLLALVIKLILYFLFIFPDNNIYGKRKFSGPFIRSSDHSEYVNPIDNLIDKGTYAMEGYSEPYAGRLPGFVFPYIVFRAIFSEQTSNVMLGVFILALAILASYVLSLLLFNLTQKRWAFIAGFLLINFVPYFWHYEWALHPSSLGVSCLIFFSYGFYEYISSHKKKALIIAGIYLAWLVLLRGFCLVYLPIVICFLFYFERSAGKKLKEICITCFIFLLPFGIFESMWITRNFISLHKFVPLQTSFVPGGDSKNVEYGYKSITKYSLTKVRELIFTWGGENAWYFPDSDIAWFGWKGGHNNSDFQFDESIFYEGFTKDTLIALRKDVFYSYGDSLNDKQHDSIEAKIINTSIHLKEKFKANKTAYFYFYAPIKRTKNYLLHNPTQDWPGMKFSESNFLQKGFKLLSVFNYIVLLIQILIFPVLYWRNSKKINFSKFYLTLYVLLIGSILPFSFLIVMSHYTYFIFGFTLLIPIFVFNVNAVIEKNK